MHGVFDPLRESLGKVLHLVQNGLLQVERIRTRHLEDREYHRRVFAEEGRGCILQRAQFDACDVTQSHKRSGA